MTLGEVGVNVIAVGIGDIDTRKLSNITDRSDRVLRVKNYDDLLKYELISKLGSIICNKVTEPDVTIFTEPIKSTKTGLRGQLDKTKSKKYTRSVPEGSINITISMKLNKTRVVQDRRNKTNISETIRNMMKKRVIYLRKTLDNNVVKVLNKELILLGNNYEKLVKLIHLVALNGPKQILNTTRKIVALIHNLKKIIYLSLKGSKNVELRNITQSIKENVKKLIDGLLNTVNKFEDVKMKRKVGKSIFELDEHFNHLLREIKRMKIMSRDLQQQQMRSEIRSLNDGLKKITQKLHDRILLEILLAIKNQELSMKNITTTILEEMLDRLNINTSNVVEKRIFEGVNTFNKDLVRLIESVLRKDIQSKIIRAYYRNIVSLAKLLLKKTTEKRKKEKEVDSRMIKSFTKEMKWIIKKLTKVKNATLIKRTLHVKNILSEVINKTKVIKNILMTKKDRRLVRKLIDSLTNTLSQITKLYRKEDMNVINDIRKFISSFQNMIKKYLFEKELSTSETKELNDQKRAKRISNYTRTVVTKLLKSMDKVGFDKKDMYVEAVIGIENHLLHLVKTLSRNDKDYKKALMYTIMQLDDRKEIFEDLLKKKKKKTYGNNSKKIDTSKKVSISHTNQSIIHKTKKIDLNEAVDIEIHSTGDDKKENVKTNQSNDSEILTRKNVHKANVDDIEIMSKYLNESHAKLNGSLTQLNNETIETESKRKTDVTVINELNRNRTVSESRTSTESDTTKNKERDLNHLEKLLKKTYFLIKNLTNKIYKTENGSDINILLYIKELNTEAKKLLDMESLNKGDIDSKIKKTLSKGTSIRNIFMRLKPLLFKISENNTFSNRSKEVTIKIANELESALDSILFHKQMHETREPAKIKLEDIQKRIEDMNKEIWDLADEMQRTVNYTTRKMKMKSLRKTLTRLSGHMNELVRHLLEVDNENIESRNKTISKILESVKEDRVDLEFDLKKIAKYLSRKNSKPVIKVIEKLGQIVSSLLAEVSEQVSGTIEQKVVTILNSMDIINNRIKKLKYFLHKTSKNPFQKVSKNKDKSRKPLDWSFPQYPEKLPRVFRQSSSGCMGMANVVLIGALLVVGRVLFQ